VSNADLVSDTHLNEPRRIKDGDPSAAELQRSALYLLAQDAVDGCPRRSRQARELALGQRHDRGRRPVAEQRHELAEPPQHARLRALEQRLGQEAARPPQPLGEQPREHVVHLRVLLTQSGEVVPVDRVGLSRRERRDGRRAGLSGLEQGELAEGVARPEHGHRDRVSERRLEARGEVAANDEVKRVGRIAAMEHDLVPGEPTTSADADEAAKLRLRKIPEQLAAEHLEPKCDERDTACVKRRNLRKRPPPRRVCVVMNERYTQTGGGTTMLRKLVISVTAVFAAASVLFASTASAMVASDGGGGAVSTPVTSTPSSFPWGDVALGVALAAAIAVCLVGAFYLGRNRRRLAALHS
jgi:hypothetical protein